MSNFLLLQVVAARHNFKWVKIYIMEGEGTCYVINCMILYMMVNHYARSKNTAHTVCSTNHIDLKMK